MYHDCFDLKKYPLHFDVQVRHNVGMASLYQEAMRGNYIPIDTMVNFLAMRGETTSACSVQLSAYYAVYGRHTYWIGPAMQHAFQKMALNKIPYEALDLPYPTMYFAFPEGVQKLWGGDETQWHNCTGAYVMRQKDHNGGRHGLQFLFWGPANDRSNNVLDDALYTVPIAWDDFDAEMSPSGQWLLDAGAYVDSYYDNISADMFGTETVDRHILRVPKSLEEERNKYVGLLMKTVLGALLYISTCKDQQTVYGPDEDKIAALTERTERVKNPKRLRALHKQIERLSGPKIIWIGRDIEDRARKHGFDPKTQRCVGFHYRTAHWHRYRVGPKYAEDGRRLHYTERPLEWIWTSDSWVRRDLQPEAELQRTPGTVRRSVDSPDSFTEEDLVADLEK